MPEEKPKPDPFDPCRLCTHHRRAHDSGGCGKWLERSPLYGPHDGKICYCRGFVEMTSEPLPRAASQPIGDAMRKQLEEIGCFPPTCHICDKRFTLEECAEGISWVMTRSRHLAGAHPICAASGRKPREPIGLGSRTGGDGCYLPIR